MPTESHAVGRFVVISAAAGAALPLPAVVLIEVQNLAACETWADVAASLGWTWLVVLFVCAIGGALGAVVASGIVAEVSRGR